MMLYPVCKGGDQCPDLLLDGLRNENSGTQSGYDDSRRGSLKDQSYQAQQPSYGEDLDGYIPFAWISALIVPVTLLLGIA